jgi:hypothetical protein
VFSLDFGVVLGGFCIFDMSFYQNLLTSTLLLLIAVVVIVGGSRIMSMQPGCAARAQEGIFVAVYLLLFAYPVISVRVVEAFACHQVDGASYLRADYRIRCDTPEWVTMTTYAGVWIVAYVAAFPLLVFYKLWSYRSSPTVERVEDSKDRIDLRFLLNDYKLIVPMLLWEGIEIVRKLLLSIIGAFWSSQSTLCIATACLISAIFLVLHASVAPYKSYVRNCVQTLALTILSLLYFIGVLLKSESVEERDREGLGVLMMVLLAAVFVFGIGVSIVEVYLARRWIRTVSHAFKILYEGKVHQKTGIPCVASFPGKFEQHWRDVVALGSNTLVSVSVACVFLPLHTPRFGQHVDDPETGRCNCHAIYGEVRQLYFELSHTTYSVYSSVFECFTFDHQQKPWGCAW